MSEQKVKWAARWSCGPELARVRLEKETKKTFIPSDYQTIVGSWLSLNPGRRAHKSKYRLFNTRLEAIDWLIGLQLRQINAIAENLKKSTKKLASLKALHEEVSNE